MLTHKRNAGLVTWLALIVAVSTTIVGCAGAATVSSDLISSGASSAAAADQFDLSKLSEERIFDPSGLAQTEAQTV